MDSRRSSLLRCKRLCDASVRQIGYGLGSIFFIPNPWLGLILWLALLSTPRFGAFALLGLLVGALCKRALQLGDAANLGGGLKANALLSAVATAWLVTALEMPLWLQVVIAALVAALAAMMTAAIMSVLHGSRFPVMVTGYALVASALFILCPNCTLLSANTMDIWLQPQDAVGWIESFVRSMGSLVYSPSVRFGILVCLAMFLWSRTALMTGIAAWGSGAATAVALQALGFSYYFLPLSYNFFMVGVALGAELFLPSRKTLLVAIVGGVLCSLVGLVFQVGLQGSAISYLPFSSIITIWLGIGMLTLAGNHAVARRYTSTRFPPEVAWCRHTCLERRFGRADPLLAVPLLGPLVISQGFSGKVTHVGAWQHAFDFQFAPSDVLPATSLWGAAVISPGAGTIERVRNDVPDNPLGGSNFANNWGNHVVLRLEQGGWVLLAHLMQGSIVVKVGDHVEPGYLLGRVGNSGRSPVPHLHMQLQEAVQAGSPTTPFKLANFLTHSAVGEPWLQWHASGVPEQGRVLQAAPSNPLVFDLLSTMMPGSAVWFCEISGVLPKGLGPANSDRSSRIEVTLDEAGRYRFDSGKGGRLIACLDPDAWRITELERVKSPFLKLFGIATPSIPYALQAGMKWEDVPPLMVSGMGFTDSFAPFFGKDFPRGHYEAVAVPQSSTGIEIRATFEARDPLFPSVLVCRFERLRGPVLLRAEFPEGVIEYTALSFEPGLPASQAVEDGSSARMLL